MRSTLSAICLAATLTLSTSAAWSQANGYEISEDLVVMSHWTVRMPFAPSASDPLTIGQVNEPMWEWIKEGGRVISVNGMEIGHLNALPAVLRMSTKLEDQTQLSVKLGTGRDADGALVEQMIMVPIVQDTVIKNGIKFETVFDGMKWVTTVVDVPSDASTDLKAGDRIVSLEGVRMETRTGFAERVQRGRRKGEMDFSVQYDREGDLRVGSISLERLATENQRLASLPPRDVSKRVVLSHWSLRLPMVADVEDPAVVAWVSGDTNLQEGDRILSVNGIGVGGLNAVPAVLRLSTEPGDRTALDVDLGVASPTGEAIKKVSLPIVQDTVLGNGLRFETIHNGSVWATTLVEVPEDVETDLEVGDRILAYGEGQPFNTRTSLSEVFEGMRREGVDEFNVFVMRGGEFMTCKLMY